MSVTPSTRVDPDPPSRGGIARTVAAAPAPALSLRHIDKHFGERQVLADIGFDVAAGEVVAVVGASGCGKSTLLNIVSGLLRADGGSIAYHGIAAQAFTGWQSLAYMFQEDRLLPWRTLAQNVGFGLEAQNVPVLERRERVREAVALVGLEASAGLYPHELSGGMRSRAALARSLVTRPTLLLMDEPFSKLDPTTRAQMHDEVLRIKALMGMTIVFVTHDIEEAVVLADRVVLLRPHPGRIGEIAPVVLPRPRVATDQPVAEAVRQLRLKV
ncbi:ABC transporter ATP-binding protein [Robbsia sp. Bb-Pol-6]|uniref:ABC transporter ATP-binding protein n=1 Tax=Robbsia betulipollinis TaxID=2981849 RepID=A0ABT3ZKE9_9BURK|nr:ABC transporter ATP-binding protein [Robbsia betulipollinis]MCY0386760.1 ABC transporter ATP-binding protein [Robbsia betulipollinis]